MLITFNSDKNFGYISSHVCSSQTTEIHKVSFLKQTRFCAYNS